MPYTSSGIDKVSVIIVVNDGEDIDARVQKACQQLQIAGCESEIFLVDKNLGFEANSVGRSFGPKPIEGWFRCVGDAIAQARFRQIAIVDAQARLTTSTWNSLKELDRETVRLSIDVTAPSTPSKRFWLLLLSVVTRLLLKTRKTEYTPGVTIFRANQVRHFINRLQGISPVEDVIRLLALTRQQGQAASELITYRRRVARSGQAALGHSTEPAENVHLPKSKVILATIGSTVRFWFNQIMFPVHQMSIASPKPKKKNEVGLVAGLVVLSVLFLFSGIGFPLLEPDEARNAQLAMNIQETGGWSALMLRNEHYWDKPPLQHWAIAVSQMVVGPSPWSTRFPIALASFFTVMLTFFIGKKIVGFRAAWIASLCLLLTIGFLLISRYTTMDATLTLMVTASMLLGLLSLRGLGNRPTFRADYAILASVAVGLGLMVKGPVIVVLCLPPLLLASWFLRQDRYRNGNLLSAEQSAMGRRRFQSVRWRWLCYTLPAMFVAAPWFVWVSIFHPDFLNEFVWRHNVVRFANGFNHQQPFYFYFVIIFVVMFPVSYLFPSAIKFLTTRDRRCQQNRSRELGLLSICIAWIFFFFSISTSKLVTYIVPTFPLICLMLGVVLEQQSIARLDTSKTFLSRLIKRSWWELPAWSIVICLIATFAFQIPWESVVPWSILCCGLGGLAWYGRHQFVPHRARRTSWITIAAMSGVLAVMVSQVVFPGVARKRSDQLAVAQMLKSRSEEIDDREQASRGEEEVNRFNPAVVYVGRDAFATTMLIDSSELIFFEYGQVEQAAIFLNQNPDSILVSSGESLERLRSLLENSPSNEIEFEKAPLGRHVYLTRSGLKGNDRTALPNRQVSRRPKPASHR